MKKIVAISATILSTAPAMADDAKFISMADLAAQTHKWDGKKIKTTAQCFYADKSEIRCVGAHTRIDVTSFSGVSQEKTNKFEDDCDLPTKALTSSRCRVTFVFTYDGFSDAGDALNSMTLVKAAGNVAEMTSTGK